MIARLLLALIWFAGFACLFAYYHYYNGFMPTDKQWWLWLLEHAKQQVPLPKPYMYGFYTMLGCCLTLMIITLAFTGRAKSEAEGELGKKGVHGSASWGDWKDARLAALDAKVGATIGGIERKLFGIFPKVSSLLHNGPEFIFALAPTRSGKGISLVLPTLLKTWQESCLVFDIKGENFALSSGYRASLGHKIIKFDPANQGSASFNPLEEVRDERFISDIQNIASIIMDPEGKGIKDYFDKAGFDWLATAIAHTIIKIKQEQNRPANFGDVMDVFNSVTISDDDENDEDVFEALLKGIINYEHGRDDINRFVANGAKTMLVKADKERSGVHSSAYSNLIVYTDPIIINNTSQSSFKIHELMNGDSPVALYVIVAPEDLDRLRPLLRLLINQILRRLTGKMEFKDGATVKHYKKRLLLLMDEFTSLGKLEIFEQSMGFMAGYGLKAFIVAQDYEQLKKYYGREETITSNCHIRIAFAPNKLETAEWVSKMLGKTTVLQKKRSRSGNANGMMANSVSDSISEVARDLMNPAEVMQLRGLLKKSNGKIKKPGAMLILTAGFKPIFGIQEPYFMDKELLARAKMQPVAHCGYTEIQDCECQYKFITFGDSQIDIKVNPLDLFNQPLLDANAFA